MPPRFILLSLVSFLSLFAFSLPILVLADDPVPPVDSRPDRTIPGGPRFNPPDRAAPASRPVDATGETTRGGEVTPPVEDKPTRTVTAGPRDECLRSNKPLAALIPENLVGLTTAQFPTWFFYIPETSAKEAEFTLRDENNDQIYKINLKINNQPGVVYLTIPNNSTSSPLVVGNNYRWNLALKCNPQDESKDKTVGGFIQRIEPSADLVAKLRNAKTMRDRINVYAQAGIWYDAIATLAQLRSDNPTDTNLAKDWASLMKQVGLNEVAEEPLLRSRN